MDQDSIGSEEEELTFQLYNTLRKHLGGVLPDVTSGWQLLHCIKVGMLPFLRSAALFFHYLNSTTPPADLLGVRQQLQGGGIIIRFPRESNRLIRLPEDYSVLINQASSFTCPRSGGDKSRAPTLCLVCGSLLCSQSYCCQTEVDGEDVGACTAHTFTCGAGLGLFLRRGNPLHLCLERYQKIERLWHQHGIAEVIGHAQEANQTLVTIDWQHL
ncbi:hypothetical protein fugu_012417 [Takifugu bimaculatus]|uniref:E3 ubiquitin-protein ligase n=1 Tax=Takifugu bimaculatus TaxID=433685 RepID=A0A4Z2C5A9_9TELE|nr:hypothetical protein fugu_012417 [Takifugu bimaculatus]